MAKHRARLTTRDEWIKPWRLAMWRKPDVKTRLVKCAFCEGQEPEQRDRTQSRQRALDRRIMREHLEDAE